MREKRFSSVVFRPVLVVGGALLFVSVSMATTERTLHNFIELDRGAYPQASLVADAAGNVYGTTPSGGTYGFGTVFKVTHTLDGRSIQRVLYSFGADPADGLHPQAGLVIDSVGNLYGTAYYGPGSSTYGTVFKLSPQANGQWTENVLHSFTGRVNGDGAFPAGRLIFDGAGNLYGTTVEGGAPTDDAGTVFELKPASGGAWTENVLYSFTAGADGSQPTAGLILDKQGNLYGTTKYAGDLGCDINGNGPYGCGTVFRLSPKANGMWSPTVLYTFTGDPNHWIGPVGGVISDAGGNLYGMSANNSGGSSGTVFELVLEQGGSFKEKVLHNFSSDGSPVGDLIVDSAGNLYGATYSYGATHGVVFKLIPRAVGLWREAVLHQFRSSADGSYPAAGVIADVAGNLYGTTAGGGSPRGLGVVFQLSPRSKGAWKETLFFTFPATDGSILDGGLISDSQGNLYGVTNEGGSYECYASGCGTVFELSRSSSGKWKRIILYHFRGGSDGSNPMGSLIFDQSGNLYGTTELGGNSRCSFAGPQGCGTVFELSPDRGGGWKEKVLYRFQGPPDGEYPESRLVFDGSGNLYGTAAFGGPCNLGDYGCGVVFELSPTSDGMWKETILYEFTGQSDGSNPHAGLVIDAAGHLYGTTLLGGNAQAGYGVVFELTARSGGWKETVLHTFSGQGDGGGPMSSLVFDASGNLYGTTVGGGSACNYGCGTVFELAQVSSQQWKEITLHAFGVGKDGASPRADLVFDDAGNLYGTTSSGYAGYGTVFRLSPTRGGSWREHILHIFVGPPVEGAAPVAGLIFGLDGKLYGTTSFGGPDGYVGGAVFEISP
jgi:uncharacterized repeat protein (TIGR03803 family)